VLTWNKGASKIEGYPSSEVIGKNCRIFHTPEDRAAGVSEAMIAEACRNGRVYREGWHVRKDGMRYWAGTTLTAVRHAGGDLRGYLRITANLSDRKEVVDGYHNLVEELRFRNETLEKNALRYRKIFQEVSDYAIILLDENGIVLEWNKGAELLKGY